MAPGAAATVQKSLFETSAPVEKEISVEVPIVVTPQVEPVASVEAFEPPKPVISKSPFAEGAKPAKKPWLRDTWNRGTGFAKGLIQRFFLGRKSRPLHEAATQAELALEKVTVLRNDLNEDDLEVVLVERKVGTGEKPLARLSKMEMPADAWIRLTSPFRKKDGESADNPKAGMNSSPELIARV